MSKFWLIREACLPEDEGHYHIYGEFESQAEAEAARDKETVTFWSKSDFIITDDLEAFKKAELERWNRRLTRLNTEPEHWHCDWLLGWDDRTIVWNEGTDNE